MRIRIQDLAEYGSRIPIPNPYQAKNILTAVFSNISQQQFLAPKPYVIFRKTLLKGSIRAYWHF